MNDPAPFLKDYTALLYKAGVITPMDYGVLIVAINRMNPGFPTPAGVLAARVSAELGVDE